MFIGTLRLSRDTVANWLYFDKRCIAMINILISSVCHIYSCFLIWNCLRVSIWSLLKCHIHFNQDYFGDCSETVIMDHVVTVYELLEEMLDNGFPLATESNVLKEMIRPPTMLRSVVNTLTGKSRGLSSVWPVSGWFFDFYLVLLDLLRRK